MRAYLITIALLCAFIFGATGAQQGFSYGNLIPFGISLSVLAYVALSNDHREGPINFDRLTHF